MSLSVGHPEAIGRTVPTLAQRCVRLAIVVANLWVLAGAGFNLFNMGITTGLPHRLHILGLGCYLVSAGLYSVALPLHYVVRESETAA